MGASHKLADRYDLDIESKLIQVTQSSRDRVELSWSTGIFIMECTNMKFRDDQLIPGA